MDSNTLANAIDAQRWLDPVADGLQKAVETAYRAGGAPCAAVENALHGTWLGHPLHPVLTDVPLGAWTVAAACDTVAAAGNGKAARAADVAADAAIAVGLVGALGAAVTGATDWHKTSGKAKRVGIMHGLLNLTATGLYTTSWVLRKRGDREAARGVAWLGYLVAGASAYLGGNLVYEQKIGIDHSQREQISDGWHVLMDEGELADNTPRRVEVEGVRLVVVRQGNRVYALDEQCSHLGGPLAEGTVEGESIRCPWHGSRFSLVDGHVLEGPSTYVQPCFDARIVDGHVEVRRGCHNGADAAGAEGSALPSASEA